MTDITSAQVSALKAALVSGKRRVRFGDREIEYRTLAEMKEALAIAEQELAGKRRIRRTAPYYDDGL